MQTRTTRATDWTQVAEGTIVSAPRSRREEQRANEALEGRGLHLQCLSSGRRRVDPISCVFARFGAAS